MPSAQSNEKVTVSAKSLEEVLEALQSVADAIAANTAVISGTGGGSGGGGGPDDPTTCASRRWCSPARSSTTWC